jgi:hypothetical protein
MRPKTPENVTPDSGVGVEMDFFEEVGSGFGLPQITNTKHLVSELFSSCLLFLTNLELTSIVSIAGKV